MTTEPTPADLLCQAGETLYGEQWKSDLARLLNVSLRRLQYYAANQRQPPPSMLLEVALHLDARAMECGDVAAALRARAQILKPESARPD